jgi:hypothetical protein
MLRKFLMFLLYGLSALALLWLLLRGWEYYRLPLLERPHSPLHQSFRPSGFIGHGAGIIGSLLMSLLFLYSARKRFKFMRNMGNLRNWLAIHIWMGITGPLLVIFHTSFKIGGIVAVSFWSMTAVALSGALGRYLYVQIPHGPDGEELNEHLIRRELNKDLADLHQRFNLNDEQLSGLRKLAGSGSSLLSWIIADIIRPWTSFRFRVELQAAGVIEINALMREARRTALMTRRLRFLNTARRWLHHWHIVHKPFAWVMIIVMLLHVAVSIIFGYRWVF